MFSNTLLQQTHDSRRSLLEHDLYDERESCIGHAGEKSRFGLQPIPQKDISTIFCDFYQKWKVLFEDPLSLTEEYTRLTGEFLELFPEPGSRSTLSKKKNSEPYIHNTIDCERSVWRLIHAMYADRLNPSGARFKSKHQKFHSEKEIINHLYNTDDDLRETQIIVDWLEGKVRESITNVAERYECLFNETTVWENTHHLLETLSIDALGAKNIISQFFPDSAIVGDRGLVQADIVDENRFLRYIFLCVRAGDIPRAQRICLQRGDISRAVAMEGWRPFHSAHLSKFNNIGPDEANDGATVEGNASRVISKCVTWWNAENTALNPYERAIFAAQSGHLRALLQAMTSGSWDDLLWAHCRALVEARVDASLRTTLDCGPRADTLSVIGRPQKNLDLEDVGLQVPDQAWIPASWTLSEAFTKTEMVLGWSPLGCLDNAAAILGADGTDASFVSPPVLRPSEISAFLNPTDSAIQNLQPSGDGVQRRSAKQLVIQAMFFEIYRSIALREYNDMLAAVASVSLMFVPPEIRNVLSVGVTNASWSEHSSLDPLDCQILRFLAHFVLCLQRLETNLPTEHCTTILEMYIATLILERRFPLIAEYTAHLMPFSRQTRWYASFLSGLRKPDEREQCLAFGAQAGLNMQSITRAVIRIARRRFDELDRVGGSAQQGGTAIPFPSSADHIGSITGIVGADVAEYLTQADKNRIAAIDWLVHDPAQRGEALVLGNSLLRLFIAMRKLGAARAVLDRLPLAILDQLKLKLLRAEEEFGAETTRAAVPPWLANTVREHECLLLYLQACESFKQWYEHLNASKPLPPPTSSSNTGPLRATLAERVAAEEAEKNYHHRLNCWKHEVELSTTSLVAQLKSLLTYEAPGWLVDATVLTLSSATNASSDEALLDVTGMFQRDVDGPHVGGKDEDEEEDEEVGIAGLGDSPHARKLQLTVLRETCLREIVFMLVEVYKTTGRHADCVRLADLVADNEFGIYKLFSERKLQCLLREIQESMLFLQTQCGDALGYPAAGSNDASVTGT